MSVETTALELNELAVGHGKRRVLTGVSCTIAVGEVVALVGRNGAGKSTLLRALAGLSAPLAGELRWFGAARLPDGELRAKTLGVVLQHEPVASLTVRQVLGLSGASDAVIDTCIAAHRLQPLAARRVNELSGGERQRVALARAAVVEPRLYVLDEPTNQLDRVEQRAFATWLSHTRRTAALVIATHSSGLLAEADRLLHVSAGGARMHEMTALAAAHGDATRALEALLEADL